MTDLFTIGFPVALSVTNLSFCFLGVFLGTFIGCLPGIGALAALPMLLPITFYIDPLAALIMLAGLYYGCEYGGSIASILLNLPGTPANAVTCLDGYPMAQQGRAGIALFITTMTSFIGGTLGIIALMFLTPALMAVALSFRSPEYFAITVCGLLAAATVTQGAPLKGIAMVVLGLLLACVGMDVISGEPRFTFGVTELSDGFPIVTLAMGLFGVSEIIKSIVEAGEGQERIVRKVGLRSMIPTRDDLRRSWMPALRGTLAGGLFGALPGTGAGLASFVSYAWEKRIAKDPSRFGKGAIEGIASPEASNNAAVQTAFIPTLGIGIPGTATMAIILGALSIHGVTPGPRMLTQHADMYWGLIASFWIGNVMLVILNIPLIGIWVRILQIPYRFLYPVILALICVGVYCVHNSVFDVWLVVFFGVLGYGMRLLGFEPAPLLIGYILGTLMEENLKRAMLIARGDFTEILFKPISGTLLAIAAVLILWALWSTFRAPRQLMRSVTTAE